MNEFKFKSLNSALIGLCRGLITDGVYRYLKGTRCLEFPKPVLIEISNPCARFVTLKERKWNPVLGFAESLWLAKGLNDISDLPGFYANNLFSFSDDGRTMRAGYGPRIRFYNGEVEDYNVSVETLHLKKRKTPYVDQLQFAIDSLILDPNSRQSIISIGDPMKDCFKKTKDYPCTRTLQFIRNHEGELDMLVHIRSNDLIWGFSAVNVFNFTLMQEYVSYILGIPIGSYYHVATNLHVYERHLALMEKLASQSLSKEEEEESNFKYPRPNYSLTLDAVDGIFNQLVSFELSVRGFIPNYQDELAMNADIQSIKEEHAKLANLPSMFRDWALSFLRYWSIRCPQLKQVTTQNFAHPLLQRSFQVRYDESANPLI